MVKEVHFWMHTQKNWKQGPEQVYMFFNWVFIEDLLSGSPAKKTHWKPKLIQDFSHQMPIWWKTLYKGEDTRIVKTNHEAGLRGGLGTESSHTVGLAVGRDASSAPFTFRYLGVDVLCFRDGKEWGYKARLSAEPLEDLSDKCGTGIFHKTEYQGRVWIWTDNGELLQFSREDILIEDIYFDTTQSPSGW